MAVLAEQDGERLRQVHDLDARVRSLTPVVESAIARHEVDLRVQSLTLHVESAVAMSREVSSIVHEVRAECMELGTAFHGFVNEATKEFTTIRGHWGSFGTEAVQGLQVELQAVTARVRELGVQPASVPVQPSSVVCPMVSRIEEVEHHCSELMCLSDEFPSGSFHRRLCSLEELHLHTIPERVCRSW